MTEPDLESEARMLRDKVYGKKVTDGEWKTCSSWWVKDIQWLREWSNRPSKFC